MFGRAMPIRLSNTPEPVPLILTIEGRRFPIFDPSKTHSGLTINIYPGEKKNLVLS